MGVITNLGTGQVEGPFTRLFPLIDRETRKLLREENCIVKQVPNNFEVTRLAPGQKTIWSVTFTGAREEVQISNAGMIRIVCSIYFLDSGKVLQDYCQGNESHSLVRVPYREGKETL